MGFQHPLTKDIDSDVQGERRDEVKRYIEQRYGEDNVASIGTYTTFKMKAIVKDFCRLKGLNHETVNYFTSFIEPESTFEDLMKSCLEVQRLKKFIKDNTDVVNLTYMVFRQQKTSSVHAAGVVITPSDKPIATLTPIKMMDGHKTTEWEMEYIDTAGFLKQDILGIRQLDKFKAIFDLVQKSKGIKLNYDSVGLQEPDVYWLFQEGFNEDVFQFGAKGLRAYCQDLKPENLEDLIATVALYRPGAMEINAHNDYVDIKNGKKKVKYDWGCEEITKETYSLYCFQEQIMQICNKLGSFTLTEADDIRSAMGKKNHEKMMKYKDIFIERAINNGVPDFEAISIWNKMEGFAGYAFNKSHACAYAITGYISQWLKAKYPLEFWTVSLQYSDDETIGQKISEINKISDIKVSPVDINNSQLQFTSKNNTIYWSISSVKWVGDKAVEEIIQDREKNGSYFSFSEFIERVDKSKVNKRVVTNLILSGAFDEIENIKNPKDRYLLLKNYYLSIKADLPDEYTSENTSKDIFWIKIQRELSGIGYIDFKKLYGNSMMYSDRLKFLSSHKFFTQEACGRDRVIVGFIQKCVVRKSTRGNFLSLQIESDHEFINITMWGDKYNGNEEDFKDCEGKLLMISGTVKFDNFNGKNTLFVNERDNYLMM